VETIDSICLSVLTYDIAVVGASRKCECRVLRSPGPPTIRSEPDLGEVPSGLARAGQTVATAPLDNADELAP